MLNEIQRIVAERERLTTCLQVSPAAVPLGSWARLPLKLNGATLAQRPQRWWLIVLPLNI